MSTSHERLARTAARRLRTQRLFVTVATGPRMWVDRVLTEVLAAWDGPDLRFRVVATGTAQGLVIAAADNAGNAERLVEQVCAQLLEPYIDKISVAVSP